MALVTGNYVTTAGTALPAGAAPEIEAVPSKNAVTIDGLAVSIRSQTVTPAADGSFTFDLLPTVDVLDAGFHYMLRGYYLNPDGYGGGGGFSRVDLFELKLRVPTEGGSIGELATSVVAPEALTIVSLEEPPVVIPGAWWLQADPDGDPTLGTGDYYKAVA